MFFRKGMRWAILYEKGKKPRLLLLDKAEMIHLINKGKRVRWISENLTLGDVKRMLQQNTKEGE